MSPRAAVEAAVALTPLKDVVKRVIAADAVYVQDVMAPDVVRPIPYAAGERDAIRPKPRLAALAHTLPRMVSLLAERPV